MVGRREEEILMFGNGMWDCDAIYCNIQESLNVHKQPEVSKRVVFHVFVSQQRSPLQMQREDLHISQLIFTHVPEKSRFRTLSN